VLPEFFVDKIRLAKRPEPADPFAAPLADFMRRVEGGSASTVALLDFLGLRNDSHNARRLAKSMESIGCIPIKSRILRPGGFRQSACRGWSLAAVQLVKHPARATSPASVALPSLASAPGDTVQGGTFTPSHVQAGQP
jgi:hypothetical protein